MKALATLAVVAALLGSSTGCYKAHIQIKPTPPTGYGPEHYHFGAIGIIELSSPINLPAECGGNPDAVVEIYDYTGVVASLVNAVLSYFIPVFYIVNARIGCAAPMGGPPPPGGPPPGGEAPPPPGGAMPPPPPPP